MTGVISPKPPYVTSLEVRCCVCGKLLGWKDGQGQTGVSHGFCETCAAKMLKEWETELADWPRKRPT